MGQRRSDRLPPASWGGRARGRPARVPESGHALAEGKEGHMTSKFRYLREGIIAGLIGAALVAVWFLIYDAARGRAVRTPAVLGAATFQGVSEPAAGTAA